MTVNSMKTEYYFPLFSKYNSITRRNIQRSFDKPMLSIDKSTIMREGCNKHDTRKWRPWNHYHHTLPNVSVCMRVGNNAGYRMYVHKIVWRNRSYSVYTWSAKCKPTCIKCYKVCCQTSLHVSSLRSEAIIFISVLDVWNVDDRVDVNDVGKQHCLIR